MSRSSKFALFASIATCLVVLALSLPTVDGQSKSPAAPKGSSDAKSIEGVVVRAHSIAGMPVKDPNDKDLGKVEDVVIDMETGAVRYVAISFGGFLGVGDKLFAVPFRALHVKHTPSSKSAH